MSEQYEEPRSSREMLNFIVLVVVLLGAVVIVALTRPLIFGKIVPAVMGEGIELPATEPVDTPTEQPATADEADTTQATDGEEEAVDAETADPPTTDSEEGSTAETAYPANSDTSTEETPASPAPEPITHTIKQGENLQIIAAQYGITVPQLIAANKLANPNYIRIGDTLVIPQSEE